MASGYVLEFSNRTFSEFISDVAGVNIYDSKYELTSGSKANRLRAFWVKEPDILVSKVLDDLIELAEEDSLSNPKQILAVRKIVERLRSSNGGENFSYEVALSFAGGQRDYVSRVARVLIDAEVLVFYDEYEDLWGKDLVVELERVYQSDSRYIVVFVSQEYVDKAWPNHERQSALSGRILRRDDSVLPVHSDTTKLPGLPSTVGYLSIQDIEPKELASRIIRKLGR
ncbi:MAG: TIR domain-containing protein [Nodosilinea sp.]